MKNLIFILLYCLTFSIYSQNNDFLNDDTLIIASLKEEIAIAKSDSLKCVLYFKLCDFYFKANNLNEFKACKKKANSLVNNNKFLKDLSYFYKAHDYYIASDFKGYLNGLMLADDKLEKYKIAEIYSLRARAVRNQCIVHQINGDEKKAFKLLVDKGIPLAKKGSDKEILAIIDFTLGVICFNNENYVKAEYYYNEAIVLLEKNLVFQRALLVDSYFQYSHVLLKLNKPKQSLNSLVKANKILQKHPDSNLNVAYYLERAYYEHYVNNYRNAILYYNKAIALAVKNNDTSQLMRINLLKSNSLYAMKRFDEAKSLLLVAVNDKNILLSDKREVLKQLALIYKDLKDFKNSVTYYESYIRFSDSLNENESQKIIANLEAKFKNKENENKIRELEIQKDKALLTSKYNRLHYILFGLISFILLITTIFFLKNSKNQKRIAIQKEINYNQKLNSFKSKKKLEVMQAMIDGEEAERKRIARDLHDGIGSRLSALKMKLQSITAFQAPPNTLDNFSRLLTQSIIELREIAFNLMPETLLKLGLELAIKDLCHSLSTEKTTLVFHANDISSKINANDQITIFRIVQELVGNALKHSECSEIIIDCSQNLDLFLITVEDNGKGFIWDDRIDHDGLGLKNIKNRIELLKGNLEVHSKINRGSAFNITLYVERNEEY